MIETLPHHGLLTKRLQNSSGLADLAEDYDYKMHLFNHRPIARVGYSEPFDANICRTEGPLIDITESAICDYLHGTERECARHFVRCGKSHPRTANLLQYMEALSEARVCGIRAVENLWG